MKKILCTLALSATTAGISQAALIDGLVNYWNLDGNLTDSAHGLPSGSSSVGDNGAFAGANGTGGIAFGAGLFGSGTVQDGASGAAQNNGFVSVNRSADTLFGANATGTAANTVSTSLWVNNAGFDQDWQTIVSHGEGQQYRIARRSNTPRAGYAGGVGEGPDGTTDISSGWHHIVAISDGVAGNTRLYVDGTLESTGGNPVIDDARGGGLLNFHIGANPDTGAQNREWNGGLDDVAQWNRVLTDPEIAQLYGGGPTAGAQPLGALIPEPSSAIFGLLGLGLILRRRR